MIQASMRDVGSRLDALNALTTETEPARRRELIREAAHLFFAPQPPPPAVMELFDQALECMAASLETELRLELSRRFSARSAAPSRLVRRLIGDESPAVAEPLLRASPILDEADLLAVAQTRGQGHLRAIAGRPDLTEPVSDTIVDRGDDDTLSVLLTNEAAPISRGSSEAITDRALANPALHALVVARENFPVDLLNEMYIVVSSQLRERILARNATLDPAQLAQALDKARTRLATRDGALPEDFAGAEAQVQQMRRAGKLGPSDLAGFVRYGETTKFTVALALQAGVDFGVVRRCLERGDGEALALLCKAAGYENDLFRTLLMMLRPGGPDAPWQPVMNRYLGLSREMAQRVVRFWNLRSATALAA